MKKTTAILTTLSVVAGCVGLAQMAQASTPKQDVSIEQRDVQITVINELANSITMTSHSIPNGKSTTFYLMYGLGATRENEARADELLKEYFEMDHLSGITRLYGGLLYYKTGYKHGQTTVEFTDEELGGKLLDNTSHLLYVIGQNFGTVKVDYDRCVTAENYVAKKTVATEADVLECRLESNAETDEEWYQPYFNGEQLEWTAADEARWAGENEDGDEGDGGDVVEDNSNAGTESEKSNSGDGSSDSESANGGVGESGSVSATSSTQTGYAGYEYRDATTSASASDGAAEVAAATLVMDEENSMTDENNSDSAESGEEVEVPLLGGECEEEFPWWLVALIGGLVAGNVGGYWLSKKNKTEQKS